jgi:hypothetical protein
MNQEIPKSKIQIPKSPGIIIWYLVFGLWSRYWPGLFFGISFASAENLVPNGSFEDSKPCPPGISISAVNEWSSPTAGSPDYFKSCGGTWSDVPYNFAGHQLARTGSAYCGMILKNSGSSTIEWREYIQVKLTEKLIPGGAYTLKFYLSLGEAESHFGSSSVAAVFTKSEIKVKMNLCLPQKPQCVNPPDHFISDTASWELIEFTFTADSAYSYLTIGNFYDDAHTLFCPSKAKGSAERTYVYIDDVSLEGTMMRDPLGKHIPPYLQTKPGE